MALWTAVVTAKEDSPVTDKERLGGAPKDRRNQVVIVIGLGV
jgi:hypothetical protein